MVRPPSYHQIEPFTSMLIVENIEYPFPGNGSPHVEANIFQLNADKKVNSLLLLKVNLIFALLG